MSHFMGCGILHNEFTLYFIKAILDLFSGLKYSILELI